MHANGLRFSISAHSAWAPGITSPGQWLEWAKAPYRIGEGADPAVRADEARLQEVLRLRKENFDTHGGADTRDAPLDETEGDERA